MHWMSGNIHGRIVKQWWPLKGTSVCDASLDIIFFYAPIVSLRPLISYRQVLQGDPVKIWAIWGRQNLLLILLTTLISALDFFPWEVSCLWYCPHSGEGFSLCKRKAVNKRPFFCERSPMTQWEVRAPAIISATFYRWIKLRTQYNVLLVQIQAWLLLRDHRRLSISLLHLARLNWHGLPSSLPGHQILQRDKAGAAAFVSQLKHLLLLNIFTEGLVQSFCIGNTAVFWCFWCFLSP